MNKTINLFRKFFQEIGAGKGFEMERTTIRGLKTAGQSGLRVIEYQEWLSEAVCVCVCVCVCVGVCGVCVCGVCACVWCVFGVCVMCVVCV